MQEEFKSLLRKYNKKESTFSQKQIVESFLERLQNRPLIPLSNIQEDKELKINLFINIQRQILLKKRRKRKAVLQFCIPFVLIVFGLLCQYLILDKGTYSIISDSHLSKEVFLKDGTKVTLSPNSTLLIKKNFAKSNRQVELQGEAFFEVFKDSSLPFIVKSQNFNTKVLGTSFLVNDNSVSVKSGKVLVDAGDNTQYSTILKANEKAFFSDNRLYKNAISTYLAVSSNSESLIFNQSDLNLWKSVIEKEFDLRVLLDFNPQTTDLKITGDFRHSTLESITKSVSFILGFRYKIINQTLIINTLENEI